MKEMLDTKGMEQHGQDDFEGTQSDSDYIHGVSSIEQLKHARPQAHPRKSLILTLLVYQQHARTPLCAYWHPDKPQHIPGCSRTHRKVVIRVVFHITASLSQNNVERFVIAIVMK